MPKEPKKPHSREKLDGLVTKAEHALEKVRHEINRLYAEDHPEIVLEGPRGFANTTIPGIIKFGEQIKAAATQSLNQRANESGERQKTFEELAHDGQVEFTEHSIPIFKSVRGGSLRQRKSPAKAKLTKRK